MPRALALVHQLASASVLPGTIGTALREQGYEVEVASFLEGPVRSLDGVDALVVLGSAHTSDDEPWIAPELAYLARAVARDVPVLGVCFGAQALARVLGGTVYRAPRPERGFVEVSGRLPARRWAAFHYDAFTLPPGGEALARNPVGLQAFGHGPHLGVQFHPEVTPAVLEAWSAGWTPAQRAELVGETELATFAAELAERAAECAAACRALVAGFLARSEARAAA
ncbi:type 1 glutamine amidotransferase [Pseudonocardia pini]|uniref:type 1 glutamine amidotransferase n=1 Tax=Pseudonocardia pini TaxID=2758030 RepID=UPI0015F107A0|nr:type 1 glutamine amidotransferase [Pseudonocardia pini]